VPFPEKKNSIFFSAAPRRRRDQRKDQRKNETKEKTKEKNETKEKDQRKKMIGKNPWIYISIGYIYPRISPIGFFLIIL
jgi:hypothetical protein